MGELLELPKALPYNVAGNGRRDRLKSSRDGTMDNQQPSSCSERMEKVQRLDVPPKQLNCMVMRSVGHEVARKTQHPINLIG